MKSEHPEISSRLMLMYFVVCCLLFGLGARLFYLQCIHGAYYRDQSENNRTDWFRTVAPRGRMWDCEGRVLVRNRPSYNVGLMLEDTVDVESTLRELAQLGGEDKELLWKRLKNQEGGRRFFPRIVMPDISRENLARIKVNMYRLPGVVVDVVPTRDYPYNSLAAQLFGYAREINRVQLEPRKRLGYRAGDMLGQSGLEAAWEEQLRGKSGYVQVEVDARGNRKRELGVVADQAGNDIHLTVDLDLQLAAEQALSGKRGAIAALDPRNGEVLALASAPSYDANLFSGQKMSSTAWQAIAQDKEKPLTNRAISSRYPPGSTFKVIMSIAGLADEAVTPERQFNCPGFFRLGRGFYHCHKRTGHGSVNLRQALTQSCNVYFYNLGQVLGINGIHKYGAMLGLGSPTGISLPGEEAGLLPSEQWKRAQTGVQWMRGDTVSVSIGQGYLSVTPLQMAVAVSAVANGGTVYRPLIVRTSVESQSGKVTTSSYEAANTMEIDPDVLRAVREAMVDVVNSPRGTGKRAALEGVVVAGKTGTAQVAALAAGGNNDHAWFVSFAPAEEPTIAMAVLVEGGGKGGMAAAPISKAVMEVYFRKKGMLPLPPVKDGEDAAAPAADQSAPGPVPSASPAEQEESDD